MIRKSEENPETDIRLDSESYGCGRCVCRIMVGFGTDQSDFIPYTD